MSRTKEAFTMPELLSGLSRSFISADTEMQLLQRYAWMQLNNDVTLIDGFDRFENLGMKELSFTFWVIPEPQGLFRRLKESIRYLVKKQAYFATRKLSFSAEVPLQPDAIQVCVKVSRDAAKGVVVEANRIRNELNGEDIHVVNFLS